MRCVTTIGMKMFSLSGFKKACKSSAFYLIEGTADVLSTIGTVSNLVSGLSFATANYIDQSLNFSYYANGEADATTTLSVSLFDSIHNQNQSRPLADEKYTDAFDVSLADFLNIDSVRLFSFIALSNGMALKSVSNFLKLWIQTQKDKQSIDDEFISPTWKEYGHHTMQGILSSTATAACTASIIGTMLHYDILSRIHWQYVFPSDGLPLEDGNGIIRPMAVIDRKYTHDRPLSEFELLGQFDANLTFIGNVSVRLAYGVTVNKNDYPPAPLISRKFAPIIVSSGVSIAAYAGSLFFKSKAELMRIERIKEMKEKETVRDDEEIGFERVAIA